MSGANREVYKPSVDVEAPIGGRPEGKGLKQHEALIVFQPRQGETFSGQSHGMPGSSSPRSPLVSAEAPTRVKMVVWFRDALSRATTTAGVVLEAFLKKVRNWADRAFPVYSSERPPVPA